MSALQSRWKIVAAGLVTAAVLVLAAAAAPPRPQPQPARPPAMSSMPAAGPRPQQPAPAQLNMGMGPNMGQFSFGRGMGMPSHGGMPAYPGFGMMMSGSQGYGGSMSGNSSRSSGYGGGGGGQGAGYGGNQTGGSAGVQTGDTGENRELSRTLTACGVPNEGGRLLWPVGLRVLRIPDMEELRRQIEAHLQEEAEQARVGPASEQLDQELGRAIRSLRNLMRRDEEERFSLPLTAYEDGERFLNKLESAAKLFRKGLEPSGGQTRLEAQK
jgi:hypothetical protein